MMEKCRPVFVTVSVAISATKWLPIKMRAVCHFKPNRLRWCFFSHYYNYGLSVCSFYCVLFFNSCLFLQSLLYGISDCLFSTAACFFSRYYMVYLAVYFLQLPVSSVAAIIMSIWLLIFYGCLFLQSLL